MSVIAVALVPPVEAVVLNLAVLMVVIHHVAIAMGRSVVSLRLVEIIVNRNF